MAEKGVFGHFGVDFMCIQNHQSLEWNIYAIEINLRLTGTTHPMMTLENLTNGVLQEDGLFLAGPNDTACFYVSYDHVYDDDFKKLIPLDILELFDHHSLHYCHQLKRGVVFHMLGAISQYGTIGLTCIGSSREEAKELFNDAMAVLKSAARETF